MFAIPTALRAQFEERLLEKAIPRKTHWFFIKRLRYYLDFCEKYDFPDAKKESLAPFLRKLQEKKQTRAQQHQAVDAVALYFDLIGGKHPTAKLPPHPKTASDEHTFFKDVRQSSVKEAPFAAPVSHSPSFPSAKLMPEDYWEKNAGSGEALRIADRGSTYRGANRVHAIKKAAEAPDGPRNASYQSHQAKKTRSSGHHYFSATCGTVNPRRNSVFREKGSSAFFPKW